MSYYPFVAKLDISNGSCNTFDNPSGRMRVPNKTENVNINVFIMIPRVNESKTLTNIYHANLNVNMMVQNVIQIKSGIKNYVDVSSEFNKPLCV